MKSVVALLLHCAAVTQANRRVDGGFVYLGPQKERLTMAEEGTAATPVAPAEDKQVNGDAKPKRDNKKEQKPIEELYDLSKPIPRVSEK